VGRLPDEAQAQDLRRLFEQYGIVTECDILNRYGFVHMKTEEMAVRAIKELNNAEFMGVQISVEVLEITFTVFQLI
jgi:RNA recognition motif-containing protein